MGVLERVVNSFDGGVEACLTTIDADEIVFENNVFKRSKTGLRQKLEVRVTKGKRSAFASTTNPGEWRECVDRAVKLLRIGSDLLVNPPLSSDKGVDSLFVSSDFDVNLDFIKSKAELMTNVARKKGVSSNVSISRQLINSEFLNSNGTSFVEKRSIVNSSINCSFKGSSSWDSLVTSGFNVDFNSFANRVVDLCIDSVGAINYGTRVSSVVLDFNALSELLELLNHSLNGLSVVEHNSFLEGRIGERVFSDLLSIEDKPILNGGVNNSFMDAEGTRIKDNLLINHGVVKGFFNDNYTGAVLNSRGGNSVGLAKRGMIDFNNLVVLPGRTARDELLRDCVFINDLMGTHTANPVSGDFALSALNSFVYDESGNRKPIRDVMLSGNIFDFFNKISAVGSELRVNSDKSLPLIKFSDVQLVG